MAYINNEKIYEGIEKLKGKINRYLDENSEFQIEEAEQDIDFILSESMKIDKMWKDKGFIVDKTKHEEIKEEIGRRFDRLAGVKDIGADAYGLKQVMLEFVLDNLTGHVVY